MLGYWDPIGLADIDLWGQGTEASIGARRRSVHTPQQPAAAAAQERERVAAF